MTSAWAADGPLPRAASGPVFWSIGMPKASVLPVPVRAWPMMSAPDSASGRVSSWMGKGLVMPASASASHRAGSSPKSAKEVVAAVGVVEVMFSLWS
jgi:hypothetical protein